MVKQNKLAVFDLDNTLIDSKRKLTLDIVGAFERLGQYITPEQITGNWYKLAEEYGISKEKFDEAFDQRKTWEDSLKSGDVIIFPETYEVLESLKGRDIRLALLSKSIPKYTQQKLDHFGLTKYFEGIKTVHPREPSKKQGALELIRELGPSTIERASFIGDKEEDVTIANDVYKKYSINSQGIYVNRDGGKLQAYTSVKSLEKTLDII